MTKQEQIEKMARTMCGYCSTDGKCAVSNNLREPEICANVDTQHCLYKEHAEELIENGYSDVSEYKAEIARLKAENERVLDKLADVLMCVKSTSEIDVSKLVKQAKIDVLNELKEKCGSVGVIMLTDRDIDKMIEELKK